jgi:transaldolase
MKIFIDTANVDEIREANDMGVIDGVTTNPSLVAKSGRKFRDVIDEILSIVDGPVSTETVSLKAEDMMKEAREFAGWHKNVVVKLPLTAEGLKAAKQCTAEDIKTNVTLVFSTNQALLAAKAGATYVSPFVGRLDDVAEDGMNLISDIRQVYDNFGFQTQILTASVRHPIHVMQAALIGSDVATIPFKVIQQLTHHPLTDKGIKQFLADWETVPK